jgi:hypothetical protein
VAEYEAKFVELSRFAPTLVSTEWDKCRRFEQGLRKPIRSSVVATMHAEYGHLVQAAMRVEQSEAETGMDQPRHDDMKRKVHWEDRRPSKRMNPPLLPRPMAKERGESSMSGVLKRPGRRYPTCPSCGKQHMGECLKAKGACYTCGQVGHLARNCSRNTMQGNQVGRMSQLANVANMRVRKQATPQVRSEGRNDRGGPQHTQARVFAMTPQQAPTNPSGGANTEE